MKRMIIFSILSVLCLPIFGQKADKGYIHLTFDGEKMQAQISSISVRKGDQVLFSIIAESDDGDQMRRVALEFAINSFSDKDILPDYLALTVNKSRRGTSERIDFNLRGNRASFSSMRERFEYLNCPMQFTIQQVVLKEGHLIIFGEFAGTFQINEGKSKATSKTEIKDGKFELII